MNLKDYVIITTIVYILSSINLLYEKTASDEEGFDTEFNIFQTVFVLVVMLVATPVIMLHEKLAAIYYFVKGKD
jgi:hypothetical protein